MPKDDEYARIFVQLLPPPLLSSAARYNQCLQNNGRPMNRTTQLVSKQLVWPPEIWNIRNWIGVATLPITEHAEHGVATKNVECVELGSVQPRKLRNIRNLARLCHASNYGTYSCAEHGKAWPHKFRTCHALLFLVAGRRHSKAKNFTDMCLCQNLDSEDSQHLKAC